MSRVSELSQVAQHIHKICYKYPWLINTTVTAKDTAADPEQDHLLGNSYADLSICIGFALVIPLIRAVLRKRIFQVGAVKMSIGLRIG